jgi:dolichyl-phosphate-mannose--protein O-mannosyl transferase
MLSFMLDHYCRICSQTTQMRIFGGFGILLILVFFYFADFAFGIGGPSIAYKGRQWLQNWHIYG